jgi:hypothetical protein
LGSASDEEGWRAVVDLILELPCNAHSAFWCGLAIEDEEINGALLIDVKPEGISGRKFDHGVARKVG